MDGDKNSPNNADRADWAFRACQVFAQDTGLQIRYDGMFTVIGDLLIDLRHLADQYGLDWRDLLDRANLHYEAEIKEEA